MNLSFIRESPALWNADKRRIIGGAPAGIFDDRLRACADGDMLPCEWWRVEEGDGGRVVGYGWLDVSWGDGEILLATDPELEGRGIGTFILEHLEREAKLRGLNYLYNVIRPTHPHADRLNGWLAKRRFGASEDGRLMRAILR